MGHDRHDRTLETEAPRQGGTGRDRIGLERTEVRTGQERGQHRRQDWQMDQDRTKVWNGQDWTGQDRTGHDRTGQGRTWQGTRDNGGRGTGDRGFK